MTGLLLFVGYLAALLGIGVLSQRAGTGTHRDFSTASESVGPFMMLMSLFGATMTSFALVGSTGEAYERGIGVFGLMASWAGVVHPLMFVVLGVPVWRLGRRYGYVTQVSLLRDRFESPWLGWMLLPVLVGLVVPYLLMALQSAALTVSANTKGAWVDGFGGDGSVPGWLTGLVLVAVTLVYVNTGGLRAAAWANALQTGVFLWVAVVTFVALANALGGPAAAMATAAAKHPERLVREGSFSVAEFTSYGLVGLSVGMFPHTFQHWLSARSEQGFKVTAALHPLLVAVVWLPCVLIGIWATGVLDLPPEQSGKVLGIMVNRFAGPWLGAVLTAGIVAAIMSSLDSQLLAIGTLVTEDVLLRLRPVADDASRVRWSRGTTVAMGLAAWALAQVSDRSVFDLGVWCFSGFSALVPVLVAALYWRRATAGGAMASVGVAAIGWAAFFADSRATGSAEAYLPGGMMPVAWLVLASAVTMVAVSWVTTPPSEATVTRFLGDRA
ncbi:MAG: Sodium/proline symporter [Pseudomonadota bacterium]|jgi:SSS family solute:Na+ symporter